MSFCLRPNVCKKCGKPLTLFEGWTCLECDEKDKESNTNRKNCEYRHENGNCLKVGGFCTSVDDEHCVKGGKE